MSLKYGEVIFGGDSVTSDQLSDDDRLPDEEPLAGFVEFSPSRSINFDTAEGKLKVILPITAALDESGNLRDAQGGNSVYLVSPLSPDLQFKEWVWTATFRLNRQGIGPYRFNLAPGQRKNIADIEHLMDTVVPPIVPIDNGDGSLGLSGDNVVDNPTDGTFTATSPALVDNGDGTYTITV